MKKLTFPSLLLFFFIAARSIAQGVGIGTLTPASRLEVQGLSTSTANILTAQTNYVGNTDVIGVNSYSVTNDGFGIGGKFTGGSKGLDAIVNGGAFTGIGYGVFATATGTAGTRYGVYSTATGAILNFGVAGVVTGGAGNFGIYGSCNNVAGYAGYFQGRGHFTEELRADKNMYVDDNLGVGTLSPVSKLNVVNGADASLTSNGFIQLGTTASWNLLLDDNEILARNNGAGNDLFIQNDGGNVLMCASELGGVGIGLTAGSSLATGYIFSVDGKIIAEEMRIQNSANWPDYVFEKEYDLMPLDELKASIETNKHLPNIPSASEVETDGLLVGDMQKKMMEKIEELTLYVIKLNESNKKLQEEVDALKEKAEAKAQAKE